LATGESPSPQPGADEQVADKQAEELAKDASERDWRVGDIDPRAVRKRMQQGIIEERLRPELD
jgi:hypothetical protein